MAIKPLKQTFLLLSLVLNSSEENGFNRHFSHSPFVNTEFFYAPTTEIIQMALPGYSFEDRPLNSTKNSLKDEPRKARHRNPFSFRYRRKASHDLGSGASLSSSFLSQSSFSSFPSPPSNLKKISSKGGSMPSSLNLSAKDEAIYLGSIHKESYERIINASIINHGSTPSSGQVSAVDPYIDPATPSSITAYKGITAILPCFVNNLGQRSVSWVRHRDIHVLTVGRFTFTNDDRFLSHHEDGSNEWALRLRSPKVEDSGYYECQVNTKPIITRLILLQVLEPRAIISGGTELYIKLGSTVELNCTVINTPSKSEVILWYHNQKVLNYENGRLSVTQPSENGNSTGSVLRISSAMGRDSGTFTCSPSNARAATVKVHVINGEHPAAMQTNGGKLLGKHQHLLLLLSIGIYLMEVWPEVDLILSSNLFAYCAS